MRKAYDAVTSRVVCECVKIFQWNGCEYVVTHTLPMERSMCQSIDGKYLPNPVMVNAVHLVETGVELYVSEPEGGA